jgi:tetratricopeptide (TPR) repeat protein
LPYTYNFYHRPEQAMAYNDQALAMAQELDDQAFQTVCIANHVLIRATSYRQLVETTPDAEEALRLSKAIGDPKLLAQTLYYSGAVLQWRGDFDRSLAYHHEAAEQAQQAHTGFFFGAAAFHIGHANAAKGEYEEALRWYRRLSDYASAAGEKFWMARVPNSVGGVHLELFDLDDAIRLNLEADEVARKLWPWPEPRGHSLLKVGLAYLQRGEHGRAEEFFRRAWALLEEDIFLRWRWHIPLLRAPGELALAEGRCDEAWSFAMQWYRGARPVRTGAAGGPDRGHRGAHPGLEPWPRGRADHPSEVTQTPGRWPDRLCPAPTARLAGRLGAAGDGRP